MMPRKTLPPAFDRFRQIGGVVAFAVFKDAGRDEAMLPALIASLLPAATPDAAKILRAIGGKRIDESAFFGDWHDPATGALLRLGEWTASDGTIWSNPRLADLEGRTLVSGGSPLPEPGAGGQFAYAFSSPPYGLQASPKEIQRLFDDIRALILPLGFAAVILDWSSPRLVEVSGHFEDGMEWWGVFLFTIHVPDIDRLTVIFASTTD